MTNTAVHPVKRVITFIMALLMVLSSFVYFGTSSNAISELYHANKWYTWAGLYHLGGFDGVTVPVLDTAPAYCSVSDTADSDRITATMSKLNVAGCDGYMVSESESTVKPGGFRLRVGLNTSNGGETEATANNMTGVFSLAALKTPLTSASGNDLDFTTKWAQSVTYGLALSEGVVLNLEGTNGVTTTEKYTHYSLYIDEEKVVKHQPLPIDVNCNGEGACDVALVLRRSGNDKYRIILMNDDEEADVYGEDYSIDDNEDLYYACGVFYSSQGTAFTQAYKIGGSYVVKHSGTCDKYSRKPLAFTSDGDHSYDWVSHDTYDLYQCVGRNCGYNNTKKRFYVTYDANGGTAGSQTQEIYVWDTTDADATYKFTSTSAVTPTRTGYTFKGWATSATATSGGKTFTSGNDMTLYAVWEQAAATEYDLTLNANGGKFSDGSTTKTYKIEDDETYQSAFGGTFPYPTREGYQFDYYDFNNGTFGLSEDNWTEKYDVEGVISLIGGNGDVTLPARWNANTYYVKYDANGGEGTAMSNSTHKYDTASALTSNTYSRDGYNFAGWNTKADGSGTTYADGASVSTLTSANGETVTLYAQWTEKSKYRVYFDLNGGYFEEPDNSQCGLVPTDTNGLYYIDIAKGQKYADVIGGFPYPKFIGADFAGWNCEELNLQVGGLTFGETTHDYEHGGTFTARWEFIDYTVTFDADGGSMNAVGPYTFNAGQHVKDVITAFPVPTKADYIFECWALADANKTLVGEDYRWYQSTGWSVPDEAFSAGNCYMIAQWKPVEHTIEFDANGGTMTSTPTSFTITKGATYESVMGSMPTATRNGYTFNGWYNEKYNYTLSLADTFGVDDSSVTFKAQWVSNSSVTFKAGKNVTGNDVTIPVDSGATYTFPTDASSLGFSAGERKFIGWFKSYDSTTGQGSDKGTSYTGDGTSVTYYAVYGYPIAWDANGSTYPDGSSRFITYVTDSGGSYSENPDSAYVYVIPDINGNAPASRNGYRRVYQNGNTGDPLYVLLYNTKVPWTNEGIAQNLTILPSQFDTNNAYYEIIDGFKTPVFYAIWEPSVSFNANGGTGTMDTVYFNYDWNSIASYNDLTLPDCTMTKGDAVFTGWNTKADGTGTHYDDGATINSTTPLTLYAQWDSNDYTITFDLAANSAAIPPIVPGLGTSDTTITENNGVYTATIKPGQPLTTISANVPTAYARGYTFTGWAFNGSIVDWADTSFTYGRNITLVATYQRNLQGKLTFDLNGGSCSDDTQNELVTNGATFYLGQIATDFMSAYPKPQKSGYTFIGWAYASGIGDPTINTDGNFVYDGVDYYKIWFDGWTNEDGTVNETPFSYASSYLYAVYELNDEVTLTFDYNDSYDGNDTTTEQVFYAGEQISARMDELPTPTKKGATFNGWYTEETGGTEVTLNTIVDGNMTVYAQWNMTEYTITFNTIGGTMDCDTLTDIGDGKYTVTVHYGDLYTEKIASVVPLAKYSDSSYAFIGWVYNNAPLWLKGSDEGWKDTYYSYEHDIEVIAGYTKLEAHALTLELNDPSVAGRAELPEGYAESYTLYDGEYLKDVVYDGNDYLAVPEPTCPGYTFLYWTIKGLDGEKYTLYAGDEDWNGILYTASEMYRVNGEYGVVLEANWERNPVHKLTFTVGSNYSFKNTYNLTKEATRKYSISIAEGDYYQDIIGGFPDATRSGYVFLGWLYTDSEGNEKLWESWGDAQFEYTTDVTFTGKFSVKNHTLKFVANGFTYVYDYYDLDEETKAPAVSTTATKNATVADSSTKSYTVTNGKEYTALTANPPALKHSYLTFVEWRGEGTDSQGNTVTHVIKADEWTTFWQGTYPYEHDMTYTAYWKCEHNAELTWHYSDTTYNHGEPLDPGFYLEGSDPWDDPTKSHAGVFRHHGVCKNCSQLAAFGYNVHFLARNEYMTDNGTVLGKPVDILLSVDVPTEELCTVKYGELSGANGSELMVIDRLGDGLNPELTIFYNPVLKAAKTDEHFVAWEKDYRSFGFKGDNWLNTPKFLDSEGKVTYTFNSSDLDSDIDNDQKYNEIHSTHLRLIAGYSEGYDEIVFDSGMSMVPTEVTPKSCSIVDSGYRYGVLPIKEGDCYQDVLRYIPTGKQVANYKGYYVGYKYFYNENTEDYKYTNNYTNDNDTLYCTLAWSYQDHYSDGIFNSFSGCNLVDPDDRLGERVFRLDSTVWNAKEVYKYPGKDIKLDSCFITAPSEQTDGIAQGYLATIYANNKASSDEYNKAYFTPEEQSGGTMYYKYEKNGSAWKCEPLFVYDPLTDYTEAKKLYPKDSTRVVGKDADGNKVTYSDPEGIEVAQAQAGYVVYFEAEDDFDYTKYSSDTTLIIAKEPKRYTYYMGEGVHYVFPTPVNDPEGRVYVPYEVSDGFDYNTGGVTKDPEIADSVIALKGSSFVSDTTNKLYGDVFYNDLDVSDGVANFKLGRNDDGAPVANIFTVHASSFSAFGLTKERALGYPNGTYRDSSDQLLYTGIFPYGSRGTKFLTSKDYEDYGTRYGGGLALSYVEGTKCTIYGQDALLTSTEGMKYIDLQAAYYMQWDYMCKFVSNYPKSQGDIGVGYPQGADEEIKAMYGIDDPSEKYNKTDDGNYFVYSFMRVFESTPMMTTKLFSCEDFVIKSWKLYDADGTDTGIEVAAIPNAGDYRFWKEFGGGNPDDYELSEALAHLNSTKPGAYFEAQWEKAINYTLVNGDSKYGDTPFASIKYTDAYTKETKTIEITDTTTVKSVFGKRITVNNINYDLFPDRVFTYYTVNNVYDDYESIHLKFRADRILTTKRDFSFYIVADTAMTAQFVDKDAADRFYVDANNKLLDDADENTWVVYNDATAVPHIAEDSSSSDTSANASYRLYTESATTYTITVAGSTNMNAAYKMNYGEVLTLVTSPVSGTKQFVGWQLSTEKAGGDTYISYDPIFNYRVSSSETITAIYSATAPTTAPDICIEQADSNYSKNGNDQYIARYAAPAGYDLVECGFVYSTNKALTAAESNINNPEYFRAVTTDDADDGVFKLLLDDAKTNYVFAYVYYKAPDGKIYCYLTPIVTE